MGIYTLGLTLGWSLLRQRIVLVVHHMNVLRPQRHMHMYIYITYIVYVYICIHTYIKLELTWVVGGPPEAHRTGRTPRGYPLAPTLFK